MKFEIRIFTFFVKKEDGIKVKVAHAELKLTAFMCEQRTPFKQADHLTPLLTAIIRKQL